MSTSPHEAWAGSLRPLGLFFFYLWYFLADYFTGRDHVTSQGGGGSRAASLPEAAAAALQPPSCHFRHRGGACHFFQLQTRRSLDRAADTHVFTGHRFVVLWIWRVSGTFICTVRCNTGAGFILHFSHRMSLTHFQFSIPCCSYEITIEKW